MTNRHSILGKNFLVLCLFFIKIGIGQAQEHEQISSPLQGNAIQVGALSSIQDSELPGQTGFVDASNHTFVLLKIDTEVTPFYAYNYDVKIKVTPTSNDGSIGNDYLTVLSLSYNPYENTGAYTDKVYHRIANTRGVNIEVVSINTTSQDPNGPGDGVYTPQHISLITGFNASRYYNLNTSSFSVTEGVTTNDQLRLEWPTIAGALSYEIAWTWIDNYGPDPSNEPTLDAGAIDWSERDFEINHTRTETSDLFYEIPLIYDRGFILYRVRAVGRFMEDITRNNYGDWSDEGGSTITDWDHYEVLTHEERKNWQFQASYAEEGKKKEVVSYFDGSLRNRQTVTRINSDENAIVGEVVYDAQGRPAIEILPVPVNDDILGYHENTNLNTNNIPYNNYDFDWDVTGQDCEVEAAPLSDQSGAALYYGPKATAGTYQDYVPDSQGFPFSQIEYTNDNTGRIQRKSGVGPDHKLGTDHEMKYLYSIPSQEELNRLFGYHVGNATHYKKNVVIDPNGQVSVSYIDPQGRTIATALVADNPSTLDPIDGAEDETNTITTDLLNKLQIDDVDTDTDSNILYATGVYGNLNDGLKYESQKVFTSDGYNYIFDYDVSGPAAFDDDCDLESGNGYPFVYTLNEDVTNECGDSVLTGGTIETTIGSYTTTPQTFTVQIDGEDVSITEDLVDLTSTASTNLFDNSIEQVLNTGTYNIKKDITIDEATLEIYAQDYIRRLQLTDTDNSCILNPGDLTPEASSEACFSTCQECVAIFMNGHPTEAEAVAEYVDTQLENWDTSGLSANEIALLEERFTTEWYLFIEACQASCTIDGIVIVDDPGEGNTLTSVSCESKRLALINDMRPNGQYGRTYTLVNDQGEAVDIENSSELNVFDTDNILGGDFRTPNHYNQTDPNHYYTTNGTIVYIPVTFENGSYTPEVLLPDTNVIQDPENPGLWVTEPQYLANLDDFTNIYWQDSWAASLITYHPEYCYFEYLQELCGITLSRNDIDADGDGSPDNIEWNTDGYDIYLRNSSYEEGVAILNNQRLSDIDPYFSFDIDNDLQLRKAIIEEGLDSNYQGLGVSLLEYTYATIMCNNLTPCTVPSGFSLSDVATFNEDDKTLFWQTYVGNYQSLKSNIVYVFLNRHTMLEGCYNGCIGDEDPQDDLYQVVRDYNVSSGDINVDQPADAICSDDTIAALYLTKEKRFIPIDNLYNSEQSDQDIYEDIEDETDYSHYAQTGQCPMARDMEAYLNGLVHLTASDGTPVNLTGSLGAYNDLFLSSGLFTDLGGVLPLTGDLVMAGNIVSPTYLNMTLDDGNTTPVSLVLPSGTYSWNTYGDWYITQFETLFYQSYNATSGLFSFQILATVQEQGETGFSEVILTGTTIARIGECVGASTTDGDGDTVGEVLDDTGYNCDRRELFESSLENLMESLADQGTLNTSVNLDTLPAYTNGFLPEFFGIENATGVTWSYTSSNIQVYTLSHNGTPLFSLELHITGSLSLPEGINYISISGIPTPSGYSTTLQTTSSAGSPVTIDIAYTKGEAINFSCCEAIDTNGDNEECSGPDTDGINVLLVDGTFENFPECYVDPCTVISGCGFTQSTINATQWNSPGSAVYVMKSLEYYEEDGCTQNIANAQQTSCNPYPADPRYNECFNCMIKPVGSPGGGKHLFTGFTSVSPSGSAPSRLKTRLVNLIPGNVYTVKYDQTTIRTRLGRNCAGHEIQSRVYFGNSVQEGASVPIVINDDNIWMSNEMTFVATSTQVELTIEGELYPSLPDCHNGGNDAYFGLDNIEVIGGDGIPDACDSCPDIANTGVDTDGDGIDNACDTCPNTPDPSNTASSCSTNCETPFTSFVEGFEFFDQFDDSNCTSLPRVFRDTNQEQNDFFNFRPNWTGQMSYVVLNKEYYDEYGCSEITQNDGASLIGQPNSVTRQSSGNKFSTIIKSRSSISTEVDQMTGINMTLPCLEIGEEYTVSYDFSSIKESGTSSNAAIQSMITFGDQVWEGPIVAYDEGYGQNSWVTEDITFIATATTQEIRFLGKFIDDPDQAPGSVSNQGYFAYDNIRIESLSTTRAMQVMTRSTGTTQDNSPDEVCTYCIPQTLNPVSCTDMYPIFQNTAALVNGDIDGNGTVEGDEFGAYILPEFFDETYFCNYNYAYITAAYGQYIETLEITHTGDPLFLTIDVFGATPLNYGFNEMALVVNEYANYVEGLNEGEIPQAWALFATDYLADHPEFCPPSPLFPSVDLYIEVDELPCQTFELSVYEAYNQDTYEAYLEQIKQDFREAYLQDALSNLNEHFNLTYGDKEYQYTLYYYDQAGNLAQTVSPEGVNRLDASNTALNTAINTHRHDGEVTEEIGLLPDHTLETQYRYNSLNQLVWQKTPDGGITRFAYDDLGRIIASQNDRQNPSITSYNLIEDVPNSFSVSDGGETITKLVSSTDRAHSASVINGNGYLERTTYEDASLNLGISFGLGYVNSTVDAAVYIDVDYQFYTFGADGLRLYANGARIVGSPLTYQPGDVLKIERNNNVINYYINGDVVASVNEAQPDAPMRMDMMMRYINRKVGGIKFVDLESQINGVSTEKFSYTTYDNLGRIIEAGETNPQYGQYSISEEGRLLKEGETLPVNGFDAYVRNEVTQTHYDTTIGLPANTGTYFVDSGQLFEDFNQNAGTLRNRVSAVLYYDTLGDDTVPVNGTNPFDHGLFYQYDIHGNVKELVSFFGDMYVTGNNDNHLKKVAYEYDLISGNVHKVTYQKGQEDQFIHTYGYDADNRITEVKTSSDGYLWEKEASYEYYEHGPMARMQLGDKNVQGMDYVYTLQGWLKAVNGEYIDDPTSDFGNDGATGSLVARDAFGYSLGYYNGDYLATGTTTDANFSLSDASINNLYNGNIKQMVTSIKGLNGSTLPSQVNVYEYDQLNRIKAMNATASNTGTASYESTYTYDKNGNLNTLSRKALQDQTLTLMDDFNYQYKEGTNQLTLVNDAIGAGVFEEDLDDQSAIIGIPYDENNIDSHNYVYDEIGQLIQDNTEFLKIFWRVDGKVDYIDKYVGGFDSRTIQRTLFNYDGLGNRVVKTIINPAGNVTSTRYARDAQGNVLGVFKATATEEENFENQRFASLTHEEHHIYGSSRLGIENENLDLLTPTFQGLTEDSDLALELGNNKSTAWQLHSDDILDTQFGVVNYKLGFQMRLVEPLFENDSIHTVRLAFTRKNKVNEKNMNILDGYLKKVNNLYYPIYKIQSITDGNPIDVLHITTTIGFDETSILKASSITDFNTNITPSQDLVTLTINGIPFEEGNGLLTVHRSQESNTTTIEDIPTSHLGGTYNKKYQVRALVYTVTTTENTISDTFDFIDTNTDLISNSGITMQALSSSSIWMPSLFEDATVSYNYINKTGDKNYELSNHLGNVLSVVSDKKIPILASNGSLTHFTPDVKAYNDYYPFGMLLPGRHANTSDYRYGFQGQELDNEIKGEGNSLNYKYRMHDPRVGRFFAVDPLTSKYPHYTPYQFSGNKVIHMVELEGLEEAIPTRAKNNNRNEGDEACGAVYHCGTVNRDGSTEFDEGWYNYSDYEKVTNTNRVVTHYYADKNGKYEEASTGVILGSLRRAAPKAGTAAAADGPLIIGDILTVGIIAAALSPDYSQTAYEPLPITVPTDVTDKPSNDNDDGFITFFRGTLAPRAAESVAAQDLSFTMNGFPQLNMRPGMYMTTNPAQAAIWASVNDQSGAGKIVGYQVVAITIKKEVWEIFKNSNPGIIEQQVLNPPVNKSDYWDETIIPIYSIGIFSKLGPIIPATPEF
ncbi:RHS repeat-associated core domain-containing protein [Dokdonia sp.]|uniref:RHS repeat-associated core domain-containing protein n=1 Tax=Dokdonia sp. TaxID=2024995 RepID=UPI003265A89B